jgi:hypothetical protein
MSDGDDELWYVAENGKRHGPYTADMVQDRLNQGRFSKSAIVWKNGFSSWQPIDLHFTRVTPALKSKSPEQTAESQRSRQQSLLFYIRWVLLIAVGALFALVATEYLSSIELSPESFLAVRLSLLSALALIATANAVLWWRHSSSILASERKKGLVRVAVVACTVAVAIAVFAKAANTPLLHRVQIARASYNHYTVKVDIASGTLSIEGLIGPGLASEVSRQLRSNAAIKTVAINSIGGLLDEAMKIAHEIKRRDGLTTKAVGKCNSACILIFMSGKKRIADNGFEFGFHAGSSITPLNGVYSLQAVAAEDAEANKFLASQGVPEAFISSANALGPDKLFMVSAAKMASAGAVTELLITDDLASEEQLKVEIEQFSKQAGHERFEELRPRMITLLQTGQADSLQDAYNKALGLAR